MVVVMGIISLISTMGVGYLVSSRDQYIIDSATEELVSTIRDVQNRSISIVGGNAGWGVKTNGDGTQIKVFYIKEDGSTHEAANETIDLFKGIEVNQLSPNKNINFMSPFGTTYISAGDCNGNWGPSNKPSGELEPKTGCDIYDLVELNIDYKSYTTKIRVNKEGDIKVE
jgi:type II secretory pathway pseudopilin PulG